MCYAEHLAILFARVAAVRPCRNMVGFHFPEVVDAFCVRRMSARAYRAVRYALGPRLGRLSCVDPLCDLLLEDAYFQQLRMLLVAKDILEYVSPSSPTSVLHCRPFHASMPSYLFVRLRCGRNLPCAKTVASTLFMHEKRAHVPFMHSIEALPQADTNAEETMRPARRIITYMPFVS